MATSKQTLIISLFLITSCAAKPWVPQEPQGWLWYRQAPKQKPLDIKKKQPQSTPNSHSSKQKPLSYSERMKQVRENFDEIEAKAILEPTLENVIEFQRAQNAAFDKAESFQKMLMLAAMLEASPSDQIMSSPASRDIYYREEQKRLDQEIKALAKTHGIFFIFKNDCPYCHEFAPIVKELVNTYGFEYKAISKDGLPLKEFPEAVLDNGTIAKLNPEGIYPCLLLVNPRTQEVIPLAKGLVNTPQLKENFKVVIQFLQNRSQH